MLSRNYGPVCAVSDTSFSVEQGEIVGLLGHNGAGKTTIMRMLSGSLEPDQGRVRVAGIDLAERPGLVQASIGYLPENLPLYPEMSVLDYLEYIAQIKQIPVPQRYRELARVLRATDIVDKAETIIATLSRGYRQRVGVAQALLGKPSLLILDEPTNGLDPTQTGHMRSLIRELAQSATVLLSTHIMQEVDAICHRVLILSAGRLVVDERLTELQYGHQLVLTTDMTPAQARKKLRSCPGVHSLMKIDTSKDRLPAENAHSYRIDLEKTAELFVVSPRLSQAVIEAGAALYSLHPVQRDLETVFREAVDGSVEAQHAA